MKFILYPLSLLFGFGVYLRNKMFDWKLLRSVEFDIPVIVIGNLRVGGTGKTPHTEWLLQKLGSEYKLGVLSRGYGRKTKGFLWVNENSTAQDVGDEPLQIKKKYRNIPVAVCEDRVVAVTEMLADYDLDAIILDDAFQHRYITPSFALVLSAADKPFFKDVHLPAGRLRETGYGLKRAQALVFSRSESLDEERKHDFTKITHTYQNDLPVYFSRYVYGEIKPLTESANGKLSKNIIAVCGVSDPSSFLDYASQHFNVVSRFIYPDHYVFKDSDIADWKKSLLSLEDAIILTTEKDAMRLNAMSGAMQLPVSYLPIEVKMENEEALLSQIKSILHKR